MKWVLKQLWEKSEGRSKNFKENWIKFNNKFEETLEKF